MFKNNFVSTIRNNSNILREFSDGIVILPFGSEYSIGLKNQRSNNCVVNVVVDGKDVLDNQSLILHPGGFINLEGFLKDKKVTNKFRFIEKTKQISDYRGDKAEDGLVRIEVQWEKTLPTNMDYWNVFNFSIGNNNTFKKYTSNKKYTSKFINNDKYFSYTRSVSCSLPEMSCAYYSSIGKTINDQGITVPGSESGQSFSTGVIGELDPQVTMFIFKLKGNTNCEVVSDQPILTREKLTCPTCGTKSRSSAKFCDNCGTALVQF